MLAARGVDLGPDAGETLAEILESDVGPIMLLLDNRLVWLPALLDGQIFTHRVSAAEIDANLIKLDPDLTPVSTLTELDTYLRLSDGSPITHLGDGEGALALPAGRYAAMGVAAGDLIGLRVTATGFELSNVAEPLPGELGARLAALVADGPELLDPAIWTMCADDEPFRTATAPLGELLAAAGLTRHGDWFATSDFDFDSWHTAGRIEAVMQRHELDGDQARAVLATVQLVWLLASQPEPTYPVTLREILKWLAEPAVAAAVLAEMGPGRESATALAEFAESMTGLTPRPARPAVHWLSAMAQERLGNIEAAEASLETAQSLDPSWPLSGWSLARYASDRGDAERGLALLRESGTPDDDELVVLLEHFRPAPRPGLGRNERCWCGSGRKYKVCHLNREELPLAERAAWLYQKAGLMLFDDEFVGALLDTAEARAAGSVDAALGDGLVSDTMLFEGGVFAAFLSARGALLPADERSLAEQWLQVRRSVHEVIEVSRGQGMTLRDIRTGEVHAVRERAASAAVRVGEFYCARVVPAGDTWQVFGGLSPVAAGALDAVVALLAGGPGPVELVAALSA